MEPPPPGRPGHGPESARPWAAPAGLLVGVILALATVALVGALVHAASSRDSDEVLTDLVIATACGVVLWVYRRFTTPRAFRLAATTAWIAATVVLGVGLLAYLVVTLYLLRSGW